MKNINKKRKKKENKIAARINFHAQHRTKTTLVFLPADAETSWSLLPSSVILLSRQSATRKHLFLYPQDDRLGLKKPKKG